MAHRSNRESIVTWKGTAQAQLEHHYAASVEPGRSSEGLVVSQVEFARDSSRLASLWTDLVKRRLGQELRPTVSNVMKTDDGLFRYGYTIDVTEPQLVISPAHRNQPSWQEDFDPLEYVSTDLNGWNVEDRLMFLYGEATKPKESSEDAGHSRTNVSRAGDVVFLESIIDKPGYHLRCTTEHDLSRGGNVIAFDQEVSSGNSVHVRWEYQKKAGLWVPKSVKKTQGYLHSQTREPRTEITAIEFLDNAVNVALDDYEFSIARLGLAPGETVVDRRNPESPIVFTYSGEHGTPERELSLVMDLMLAKQVVMTRPAEHRPLEGPSDRRSSVPLPSTEAHQSRVPIVASSVITATLALAGYLLLRSSWRKRGQQGAP